MEQRNVENSKLALLQVLKSCKKGGMTLKMAGLSIHNLGLPVGQGKSPTTIKNCKVIMVSL
jgi:hypothetical protein